MDEKKLIIATDLKRRIDLAETNLRQWKKFKRLENGQVIGHILTGERGMEKCYLNIDPEVQEQVAFLNIEYWGKQLNELRGQFEEL